MLASIHFFVHKGAQLDEKRQVEERKWTQRAVGRFPLLQERRERGLGQEVH